MAFENLSLAFENESHGGPVTILVPLTGTTIALRVSQVDVMVNPAGTLAALTINMPQVPRGTMVDMMFTQIITALTIRDRLGVAITGAPSAASVNQLITMRFINPTVGWVRWF